MNKLEYQLDILKLEIETITSAIRQMEREDGYYPNVLYVQCEGEYVAPLDEFPRGSTALSGRAFNSHEFGILKLDILPDH